MYPTNQCMDPYYSYCRDRPPYSYYPPPGWEAGQPQMAMDSSCRPPSYAHLPSSSTSHSHLPESHNCCNKTYPPGYYSHRPSFPQELPPPNLYSHGPFPYHLNTYPSYFVPPPTYPVVDQIPYGYGKFMGHCCGCPNHVCHGIEKSKLKIEEELPEVKPDSEQKGADNSSIIGHPSYQYPVVRLPSGNMKDDGKGRSFEMPPQLFSKWFPESGEWTGDGKQQSHDNHNATRQFQWPIIRMPAVHDEPKQENKEFKEVYESPKVTKEAPHSPDVKIIPMSWFENDRTDQKPVARDGSGEHNGRSSATYQSSGVNRNFKTIPVVPGEIKNENKSAEKNCKAISALPDKEGDENKVRTCRTIPVMVQKKDGEKVTNVEKKGENRKSNDVETSKPKLSKLPPVCLRVDPLPRKKSGNNSSGLLNFATKKVCEKENGVKEAQSKNQENKLSEPIRESKYKECNEPVKEKSSEMDKIIGSTSVTVQDASVKPTQEEEISTEIDEKMQPNISVQARNASPGSLQECEKSTEEDGMKFQGESSESAREINLSAPDAAVCIQSAYRGYDVRRSQPLDKLRKVKNIHDQMQDLKNKLQGLEASSQQLTAKDQVTINESIMNLLLNLDTIQGLHPSVREARKSVARELVCLQEKLDSLCKQLPSEPYHFRSEKEEPARTDNAIQTRAPVSAAEASEEENFAGVVEELGARLVDSSEMMNDEASSGTPNRLIQDAGSTEQKQEMEESSTTHDEGKAARPGECQGTSSIDVPFDAALPGHTTESKSKHHKQEPNTLSREEPSKKEKAAATGEEHEVSLVHCVESLHAEQSLSEEQCPASTEESRYTQDLNTGASSPGASEDSTTAMASLSMQNGKSVDKDDAAEGQVWQPVPLESSALNPDAAAATANDQYKETGVLFAQPCVYLKDADLHEHKPHHEYTSFSPRDEPEEARRANMRNHGADAIMQDSSAKEPDGTPEPTAGDTDNMYYVSTAIAENSVQSPLLEETLQSDSALLQDLEAVEQCEGSCKDDPALAEQPKEARLENLVGGFSIGENHEAVSMETEARTKETLHVAGESSNMCAEPCLPETVSNGPFSNQDGTMLHEKLDYKILLGSHSHSQNEYASEDKPSAGTEASEAVEYYGKLEEASVCATKPQYAEPPSVEEPSVCGTEPHCAEPPAVEEPSVCATEPHCAEPPAVDPKEDAGIQMASQEAATVTATHGGVKNDVKKLADENLKLKEMLQKLLSSDNDQLGIITELSEKVKALESKLARKRRPKVRLYRSASNAPANLH